ncbi:hypothetical protein [Microbacterium sp. NPDC089695]|uniref:hypothetical protein n=1 Tax=Microbacterium sp. NPDC089695 TaxID=3364198 RepID=UPI0037F953EF
MPPEDDAAELRALQQRAYGRDGGLTAEEAARLSELEAARVARERSAESEPSSSAHAAPADAVPTGADTAAAEPDAVVPELVEPAADPAPAPARALPGALRAHAWTAVAASLVLLLIGVAVGWGVFGRDDQVLSSAQQERRLELQQGDYDAGSVRLIAEDDDAVVWYATRRDGEIACAVLDVGEASQDQCALDDADDGQPLTVSMSVPVADPDDPADEYGTSISATVGYSTSGEPLAWIYRWEIDDAMLGQFEGSERERAEALVAEGYLPGLSIVGYFHDEPVWLVDKPADGTQTGGFVQCMVVDAASAATACRVSDDRRAGLRALSLETAEDGTPVLWTLQIRFTGWGTPYLTIEQGDPDDAGAAYVELGGEHGDPILVEVPSAGTDG